MSDKLVDFNKTQNKALKLRIFPDSSQIQTIESTFGACRFIYNNYLDEKIEFYAEKILPIKKTSSVDISWSTFVSKLEQKAVKYDCKVVKADRFFASSQTCNVCGFKNIKVKEKHLEDWKCPSCGTQHQRDINTAINLKNLCTVGTTGIYAHGDSELDYIASLAVQALTVVEVGNTVGDPVYEASTLKGGW